MGVDTTLKEMSRDGMAKSRLRLAGIERAGKHQLKVFSLRRLHRIRESANPIDFHSYDVSVLQPNRWFSGKANTLRRTGEDNRAWQKRCVLTQKTHQRCDFENHVAGR